MPGLWKCGAQNNPWASELGAFDPNILKKKYKKMGDGYIHLIEGEQTQ